LLRHGQSRTLVPAKKVQTGRDLYIPYFTAYFTVMVSRDQTPLKHTSFLNGSWSSREGLSTSTRQKSSKRRKTALIWADGRCEFGSHDGPPATSLLKRVGEGFSSCGCAELLSPDIKAIRHCPGTFGKLISLRTWPTRILRVNGRLRGPV
jgi:hypothetical protein